MTVAIIITICVLLLIAYVFDLTSARTKIPAVILLLLLGWSARQVTLVLHIQLPDFSSVLPVLGTIGLILIVLEGALELELNSSKLSLIKKSLLGALIPMLALAFSMGWAFYYFGNSGFKDCMTNAIPFCVISSAIAIPSVRNLSASNREFIIYESSLSDIFGVLLFNFFALNEIIDSFSFGYFFMQLVLIAVISFIATIGLAYLLSKIDHHVKFIPIILMVILIYAVSKIYHLPGLVFILFFGLAIGNLDELKKINWIKKFNPEMLKGEVNKLKDLTLEGAFLIKSLFFLLFGYLIDTNEVLNPSTFLWATGIATAIFLFRLVQLKMSALPLQPLLYVAPRGLITILLFLSISPAQSISLVNKSLITQVILITALVMMSGLISGRKTDS